jgi:hypothetical protein
MWMSAGRLSLPESQAAQVSDIVTRCSNEVGRMRCKDAEERAWLTRRDVHCKSETVRLVSRIAIVAVLNSRLKKPRVRSPFTTGLQHVGLAWAVSRVTPAQGAGVKAPGAEQLAPALHVIPGGHGRQVPNRAPTQLHVELRAWRPHNTHPMTAPVSLSLHAHAHVTSKTLSNNRTTDAWTAQCPTCNTCPTGF